jgi:hypothetical protein
MKLKGISDGGLKRIAQYSQYLQKPNSFDLALQQNYDEEIRLTKDAFWEAMSILDNIDAQILTDQSNQFRLELIAKLNELLESPDTFVSSSDEWEAKNQARYGRSRVCNLKA